MHRLRTLFKKKKSSSRGSNKLTPSNISVSNLPLVNLPLRCDSVKTMDAENRLSKDDVEIKENISAYLLDGKGINSTVSISQH